MVKPTLLILAAGLGSRYGGFKQLEPIGPQGEAIIDYSIFDAIKAGFGKVVFVIKKELEVNFRDNLLKRFENRIDTGYVFQELDMLPKGYDLPSSREKPWGTAHAIMVSEAAVNEPFTVINADDFYGYEAFRRMQMFLAEKSNNEREYSMIGYKLGKTLSEHGTVSRGICSIDDNGYLKSVTEITKIRKDNDRIVNFDNGKSFSLSGNSIVSMNMWGFTPVVFGQIKQRFSSFLDQNITNPKAEFFIPTLIDQLIREKEAKVKVLSCNAQWFGITYKEDKQAAKDSILEMIKNGEYPLRLWT